MRRPALTRRSSTRFWAPAAGNRQRGSHAIRGVEGCAVDQVVERAVVHRGRVAGMDGRVATLPRLAVPHELIAEPRRARRGRHRRVLRRIDLAQEHRNRVVELRAVRNVRSRRVIRLGHDQHAIEAHRPLDRRLRAGLDEIGSGAKGIPDEVDRSACCHLGSERTHAIRLSRGGEHGVTRACIGTSQRTGPGGALRRMRRARHACRRCAQAAAELPHDDERGRHRVRPDAGREGQLVPKRDAQLAGGSGDQRRLPSRTACLGGAVHRRAGRIHGSVGVDSTSPQV